MSKSGSFFPHSTFVECGFFLVTSTLILFGACRPKNIEGSGSEVAGVYWIKPEEKPGCPVFLLRAAFKESQNDYWWMPAASLFTLGRGVVMGVVKWDSSELGKYMTSNGKDLDLGICPAANTSIFPSSRDLEAYLAADNRVHLGLPSKTIVNECIERLLDRPQPEKKEGVRVIQTGKVTNTVPEWSPDQIKRGMPELEKWKAMSAPDRDSYKRKMISDYYYSMFILTQGAKMLLETITSLDIIAGQKPANADLAPKHEDSGYFWENWRRITGGKWSGSGEMFDEYLPRTKELVLGTPVPGQEKSSGGLMRCAALPEAQARYLDDSRQAFARITIAQSEIEVNRHEEETAKWKREGSKGDPRYPSTNTPTVEEIKKYDEQMANAKAKLKELEPLQKEFIAGARWFTGKVLKSKYLDNWQNTLNTMDPDKKAPKLTIYMRADFEKQKTLAEEKLARVANSEQFKADLIAQAIENRREYTDKLQQVIEAARCLHSIDTKCPAVISEVFTYLEELKVGQLLYDKKTFIKRDFQEIKPGEINVSDKDGVTKYLAAQKDFFANPQKVKEYKETLSAGAALMNGECRVGIKVENQKMKESAHQMGEAIFTAALFAGLGNAATRVGKAAEMAITSSITGVSEVTGAFPASATFAARVAPKIKEIFPTIAKISTNLEVRYRTIFANRSLAYSLMAIGLDLGQVAADASFMTITAKSIVEECLKQYHGSLQILEDQAEDQFIQRDPNALMCVSGDGTTVNETTFKDALAVSVMGDMRMCYLGAVAGGAFQALGSAMTWNGLFKALKRDRELFGFYKKYNTLVANGISPGAAKIAVMHDVYKFRKVTGYESAFDKVMREKKEAEVKAAKEAAKAKAK